MELFFRGNYGLAVIDGPMWREQRRFALHVLRNFGFDKGRRVLFSYNYRRNVDIDEPSILLTKQIRPQYHGGEDQHRV